jgi:hypothetical protein
MIASPTAVMTNRSIAADPGESRRRLGEHGEENQPGGEDGLYD